MNDLETLFQQAKDGTLPPDFNQWDIKDNRGMAVKEVYSRHKK